MGTGYAKHFIKDDIVGRNMIVDMLKQSAQQIDASGGRTIVWVSPKRSPRTGSDASSEMRVAAEEIFEFKHYHIKRASDDEIQLSRRGALVG